MAYNIKKEKERFSTFQQESWFVPLISKDMLSHMNDEREMYRRALVKLNALNAKASYLYIFEKPVAHYRNEAVSYTHLQRISFASEKEYPYYEEI